MVHTCKGSKTTAYIPKHEHFETKTNALPADDSRYISCSSDCIPSHLCGASKVEALSALRRLEQLLKEGAEAFTTRVMLEIASPEILDKPQQHDENRASSPLLREIIEAAELIRVEVYELTRVATSSVLYLCGVVKIL